MYRYDHNLLLPYQHSGSEWESTDRALLYRENLARQPESWYYRHHPVRYTWNSNGYRCPEWSLIDWASSHVIMGCSYALGVGVDDSDTISAGITNGVNLGQSGISIYNIQYNTISLLRAGIRPKTIKIIVPDLARSVYWGGRDWADLTPHDLVIRGDQIGQDVVDYYRGWLSRDPNPELASWMTAISVQGLWQSSGVPCDLYHHWMPKNPDLLLGPELPESIDHARDLQSNGFAHPGRKTLALWRDIMYGA